MKMDEEPVQTEQTVYYMNEYIHWISLDQSEAYVLNATRVIERKYYCTLCTHMIHDNNYMVQVERTEK